MRIVMAQAGKGKTRELGRIASEYVKDGAKVLVLTGEHTPAQFFDLFMLPHLEGADSSGVALRNVRSIGDVVTAMLSTHYEAVFIDQVPALYGGTPIATQLHVQLELLNLLSSTLRKDAYITVQLHRGDGNEGVRVAEYAEGGVLG